MANAYVIPWTPNPVDTFSFAALGFTYTVPAGKYAVVTWNLNVRANLGTPSTASVITSTNGDKSASGKIELVAGDVLTRTLSSPSGTSSSSTQHTTIVTAQFNLNSNIISYISSSSVVIGSPGAGAFTMQRENEASAHAIIQEYNVVT